MNLFRTTVATTDRTSPQKASSMEEKATDAAFSSFPVMTTHNPKDIAMAIANAKAMVSRMKEVQPVGEQVSRLRRLASRIRAVELSNRYDPPWDLPRVSSSCAGGEENERFMCVVSGW